MGEKAGGLHAANCVDYKGEKKKVWCEIDVHHLLSNFKTMGVGVTVLR